MGIKEIVKSLNPRISVAASIGLTIETVFEVWPKVLYAVGSLAVNCANISSGPNLSNTQIKFDVFCFDVTYNLFYSALAIQEHAHLLESVGAGLIVFGITRFFISSNIADRK